MATNSNLSTLKNCRIEVRQSTIAGRGIFAVAPISKGEVVITWHPLKRLTAAEAEKCLTLERPYLGKVSEDQYLLMGEPERYVNHSCSPNTEVRGEADIAIRDIEPGDEITSDYSEAESVDGFPCCCGADKCRRWIGPKNNK